MNLPSYDTSAFLAVQQVGAFVAAPTISGRSAAKLQVPRSTGATLLSSNGVNVRTTGYSPGNLNSKATPPPADFKDFWDKTAPAYKSSPRTYRYSNQDWWHNLVNLPRSKMLRRISKHLVANTLWAVAILAAYHYFPAFAKVND